jgi:endoglucanase
MAASQTQAATCSYTIENEWNTGFTGNITITNTSTTAINGWTVGWQYTANKLVNSFNATVTGTNPYSATNLAWNSTIAAGQSVSFGFQGDKNNAAAEKPTVTGSVCSAVTSIAASSKPASSKPASSKPASTASIAASSKPASIAAASSKPATSIAASSKPASSVGSCSTTSQCNWYGTLYPSCVTTTSGWGYENGKSCISTTTCTSQPSPYGVVSGCGASTAASSIRSSVKSSVAASVVASTSAIASSKAASSKAASSKVASSTPATTGTTAVELTSLMGVGWNLGNSLDAVGGETAWGNPLVTQQLINSVKAAGFNTIRIPVAFSQFSDAANFVISTAWMDRVEQVVKYAQNANMYVMINIHWDGGWMQPTSAQQVYVNNRLTKMWTQIATRFSGYDNHLLFAGTNEVMVDGNYGTPTAEYYTVQNSFNQTFVNAVRATGGGNASRFLVVQGFNTNIDHTVSFATIPTDTISKHLLMEVHFYDPYNFTLNTSSSITQWGSIATNPAATETWANEAWVDSQFQKMKVNFVDKGVGVILGEYGVISRTNISDSETYRVYWNKYITQSAVSHKMVPVYWDNGFSGNNGMALFDRNSGSQLYPNIISAIVSAK